MLSDDSPLRAGPTVSGSAAPPALDAGPWPVPGWVRASLGLHAAALGATLLAPQAAGWAAGAVLANHLGLSAAGLWPRSTVLGPNIRRLPSESALQGEWALTIDDGPDPQVTPALIDLLAAEGVRATFFCIAERARAQPALLRRIMAAGHSVQNHSLRHRHDFSLMGPRRLAREVGDAQALLADLSGQRPHCFRAPAGLRNPLLDPLLHRLGLHLVSWTRRGFDTREAHPERVLNRLTRGLAAGDILLLHDGHARFSAQGRPAVLDLLPLLLARCREAGLRAVTLTDALPPRQAPGPFGAPHASTAA
jgi:peptidoglycan/xylan/chitin deacetylase (PgdA/CDA1 family)